MSRESMVKGRLIRFFSISLIWIILLGSFCTGGKQTARAAAPDSPAASIPWEYQLDFQAASPASASQQAYLVSPGLNRQEVTTFLQAIGGNLYRLDMAGNRGLEQLRETIFSPLLADFLGGPAEMELALPVSGPSDLHLRLESNVSTGYGWEVQASGTSGYAGSAPPTFITRSAGYGAAGVQTLDLHASSAGTAKIMLTYRRPFGPLENATRHLRVTSSVALTEIDLTNPHPKIVTPQPASVRGDPATKPAFPLTVNSSLPDSLDWRTRGIVPPVRDQHYCGSCWAFGTVGVMESAMAKIGLPMVDLSEQFLLSCNPYGWNCEDGGLTAHMLHYDALGKNQTSIGAVLEADKPYTATDGNCNTAYNHPYSLSGWKFVASNESTVPSVEQIKSAIAIYGPVTAGVCAGYHFQMYPGGIFDTNESCYGGTNHQIILVGWQDTSPTSGYWILRNSWGSWWGENGYMRIAYGTSRVGEGASWVVDGQRYYFPMIER